LRDWRAEHAEHREAEIETMMHDLHAARDFIAQLTQMAYDGEYDGMYGAIVRCGVQAVDTHVETSVVPVEGFKGGCAQCLFAAPCSCPGGSPYCG